MSETVTLPEYRERECEGEDNLPQSLHEEPINDGLKTDPKISPEPTTVEDKSDNTGDTLEISPEPTNVESKSDTTGGTLGGKVIISFSLTEPNVVNPKNTGKECRESHEKSWSEMAHEGKVIAEVKTGAAPSNTPSGTISRLRTMQCESLRCGRTHPKLSFSKPFDAILRCVASIDEGKRAACGQALSSNQRDRDEPASLESVMGIVKRTLSVVTSMTKEIDILSVNLRRLDERLELEYAAKSIRNAIEEGKAVDDGTD